MEVTFGPDGKPVVVDSDSHDGHGHGYGHGYGYGSSDWSRTAERLKDSQALQTAEFNARAFAQQDTSGRQFAENQVSSAGISKDVAVLSKDVVISEGRLSVQNAITQKDIQVLSKDVALTEGRLNLEMAKLAAQQAECCCEIKELVRAGDAATRELIQGNLISQLKDEILALRTGTALSGK